MSVGRALLAAHYRSRGIDSAVFSAALQRVRELEEAHVGLVCRVSEFLEALDRGEDATRELERLRLTTCGEMVPTVQG